MSRSMTRDFLTEDILGGDEPTAENLQRATERILDELQKTFETFFVSYETINIRWRLHENNAKWPYVAICIREREREIKSNQIKSNQIKSNQIKSSQIKSNQIKSNQIALFKHGRIYSVSQIYSILH